MEIIEIKKIAFVVGLASTFGTVVPALATSPGSDAFGNSITGSDQDASIRQDLFFDISGDATLLTFGDDNSSRFVELGFDFTFYGTSYSELTFTTNGYISTDPFDFGTDYTNDPTLPSTLSSGGGARIYPHHDDTEALVYGDYYAADANPLGVDAFVSQVDACHFICDPFFSFDIQYNVFLLRDGTVVVAHNLSGPENGSGATVGLQDEHQEDGVAYSVNEDGAIIDGQTVVILAPNSGLSGDLASAAAESGTGEAALLGNLVSSHLSSFGDGPDVASRNSPLTFSTMGESGINMWGGAGFSISGPSSSSAVQASSYSLAAGADLVNYGNLTAGVGLSMALGSVNIGAASVDTTATSLFAYAGHSSNIVNISGILGYGITDYSDFATPFMTGISASGKRVFGSISASKDVEMANGMLFTPGLTISGGTETIDDWTTSGGTSRSVGDASFARAELTGKFSVDAPSDTFDGTGFFLFGLDYNNTFGDSDVALYSFNHSDERVGGMLGFGIDGGYKSGMGLSASMTATGIGTESMGLRGELSIDF